MNTEKCQEEEVNSQVYKTYFLNFFIFDFFNRLTIILGNEETNQTFMFGRTTPTNSGGIYIFEIRILIKKLNEFFGIEDAEFGNVSDEVLLGQSWNGLVYQFDGYHFQLLSQNGYFQLYLNFD